jgi:hypothetical protein
MMLLPCQFDGDPPPLPITYDLTSNTLSHVNMSVGSNDVTLLINNANTAGVQSFTGYGLNDKLVTAESTLDVSDTTVAGLWVTSVNGLGTAFTVGDLGTAIQIAGGAGQDTIVATSFAFSADQRNTIFATASIEKIVDQTGTYTVDIAPTITSNGGGDTAALSIVENTTAVTTVTATDPDAGQTLSYSISGGADGDKFAINAVTGALSFGTAPNFEAPTDVGGNNVYDVTVQVSDGHGSIDTQAIAVAVTDQKRLLPCPSISSWAMTAAIRCKAPQARTSFTATTRTDRRATPAPSLRPGWRADSTSRSSPARRPGIPVGCSSSRKPG